MLKWRFFKIKMPAIVFSLMMAAFFFFGLNFAFIADIYSITKQTHHFDLGFLLSVPFLLIAAFNLIFLFFSNNSLRKPVFIIAVLVSAVLSYATSTYAVIFGKEMLMNIAETDMAETSSYLNFSLLRWFFLLGVVPSVLIYKTEISLQPWRRLWLQKGISAIVSLLIIGAVIGTYYQDYVVTLRNNKELKRILVPSYFIFGTYLYVQEKYFKSTTPYEKIGLDAKQKTDAARGKKNLLILVVGEASRAVNYSLNGYGPETDKYTKMFNVDSFKNVTSCGTETAVSVPCMFSNLTRKNYSREKAKGRDNLIDILKRANIQLRWIDNDGGCKSVCDHVQTVDIRQVYAKNKAYCDQEGCLDEAFFPELDKQLADLKDENTVVVLHIMGSHGPAYYKRYPAAFAAFKPECRKSDIQNCTHDMLVNTYDNTVLYTDFILSHLIDTLQANQDRWNGAMVYLSDHGESLGEKGVFLHGLPYAIAPVEQTHIAFITWLSPAFAKTKKIDAVCLTREANEGHFSQDNLFHSILGVMDIETSVYNPALDLFHACRETTINNIRAVQ